MRGLSCTKTYAQQYGGAHIQTHALWLGWENTHTNSHARNTYPTQTQTEVCHAVTSCKHTHTHTHVKAHTQCVHTERVCVLCVCTRVCVFFVCAYVCLYMCVFFIALTSSE